MDMTVINVLQLDGALDVGALRGAVRVVAARHQAFRLQLVPQPDGSARCRLLAQPRFSFAFAGGAALSAGRAADLLAREAAEPLDLTGW